MLCRPLRLAPSRTWGTRHLAVDQASTESPEGLRRSFKKKKKNSEDWKVKLRPSGLGGRFSPLPPSSIPNNVFGDRAPLLKLPPFGPETLHETSRGALMAFSHSTTSDNLVKHYGLPMNILLDFQLFQQPVSVVRDITLSLTEQLKQASERPSENTRVVLHGTPGCGKSYALLQAAHYCHHSNWIVLYIPRALRLVDSSTSFVYDPRTRTYMQHEFAWQLLQRLLLVHHEKLAQLVVDPETASLYDHMKLRTGTKLDSIADMGLRERAPSMDYLMILIDALSRQKSFPVLLAVDDFQALYRRSHYRDPHFDQIQSFHLSLPRVILEFANGIRSFRRGAILGAISTIDKRFKAPLELLESLNIPPEQPADFWSPRRPSYSYYAKGLQALPIPSSITLVEAAALFELCRNQRALHTPANDEMFLSKYTESAGNPRDFVWKGLFATHEV